MTLGHTGTQGTDGLGHSNSRPLNPREDRLRHKQIVLVLFFVCPPWLGLLPHPARICLNLQEHLGGARHYLTTGLQLLASLLGKEEQARAPFASFSCPCRLWKPGTGCQEVT